MSRFKRIEVARRMEETGMVPVFYHKDPEVCKNILKACYDGGVRVFEFTNRGDRAHLVFTEIIQYAAKELPEMMLGIGSVVDAPTTALYIALGADFIVSPLLNEEMATLCNRRKILWSPGCMTVSEISKAESLGAEIVKAFPGSSLGPEFVKAVKGPCPWTSIMPTGGVEPTRESLEVWFKAGVTCVGMGSQLFKNIVETSNWAELTKRCKEALSIIQEVRK